MAITVTVRGTDYSIPTVGEVGWGAALTSYLQVLGAAVAAATTSALGSVKLSRTPASASAPIVIASTGGTIQSTGSNVGLDVTGSGSGAGITCAGGITNANGITATGGGTTGHGVRGVGGISASGVIGVGGATNGRGVEGVGGGGTGVGVYGSAVGAAGVSGNDTTGVGTYGIATSGDGVVGISTSGKGVWATSGSGDALVTASSSGYGAIIQGDTTSPIRAALRLVPQDTNPSSPQKGDLYVKDGDGKLYIYNGSAWVVVGTQS